MRVPLRRIRQIVNPQLAKPISYNAYRYIVRQDPELLALLGCPSRISSL